MISSDFKTLPPFSHIYVESDLLAVPWWDQTRPLLDRFPKAQVVEVSHYSEVTQRRSVNWLDQKRSPKLVLALKKSELIYPCTDVAPDFGHENFYYAVPMQNCLYDCEYCYLQGMYTSPHMVYFVNQEQMIDRAAGLARELGSLYLCIAYDNDILAVENLLGIGGQWIEGLRECPEVLVELRTKSANFKPLASLAPSPNFVLAWTLSPPEVIRRFEARTPPLEARISAMEKALLAGWRVRLCLDPLLPIEGWRNSYAGLISELDRRDLWDRFQDASYGLFRMPKQFLRQAKKARPDSALLHSALATEERGLYTFVGEEQWELLEYVGEQLLERMGPRKVVQT